MTDPIYVGNRAVEHLVKYCQQQGFRQFVLIADDNTYRALGANVENALRAQSFEVETILLKGAEIIADAHYLTEVLFKAPVASSPFIAVGSGTITDITRFTSHRSKNPFISLPTAPSVDGFTSIGAPLVLRGFKQTINCQAPIAIFADLPTLQAAPRRLIAAGFGDIIGKYISLADWKLGHLLWDEPYNEAVAERTRRSLNACVEAADEIGSGSESGIRLLIDALIESGLCMLEFGDSHPASGAEHHCSHYWEMMLLQENRPAVLHGAKVGVGATLMADVYRRIQAMSPGEIGQIVENAAKPTRESEIETMHNAYGKTAEQIIASQTMFLNMTDAQYEGLKRRIVERWDDVRAIAAEVPSGEQIAQSLRRVGGPTSGRELGLSDDEVERGKQYGHYIRDRFTVRKLFHLLNMPI